MLLFLHVVDPGSFRCELRPLSLRTVGHKDAIPAATVSLGLVGSAANARRQLQTLLSEGSDEQTIGAVEESCTSCTRSGRIEFDRSGGTVDFVLKGHLKFSSFELKLFREEALKAPSLFFVQELEDILPAAVFLNLQAALTVQCKTQRSRDTAVAEQTPAVVDAEQVARTTSLIVRDLHDSRRTVLHDTDVNGSNGLRFVDRNH
jgi:hypothetical protein